MDQPVVAPPDRSGQQRVLRHLSNPPVQSDLRSRDLLAVLEHAERLITLTDASAVPSMLEAVADLVGADSSTLTRINLRTGHEEAVLWPATRAGSAGLEHYAAASRTHPLRPPLAFQARTRARRPAPIRISDVLTGRQWRASALYATSHRGIDDQMCALIAAQQHTVQLIGLSRHRGSFTDRQVALLDAARVHVAGAVHRVGPQLLPMLQVAPTLRPVLASVAIPRPVAGATVGGTSADFGGGVPTARQRQILALVAEGLTDAQIGRRLGLTGATVSKHLTRSYARLGVPNRAAAARLFGSDPGLRTG